MKIIFYFQNDDGEIISISLREFSGTFDQKWLVVYMNPQRPWAGYACRRYDTEQEFEREVQFAKSLGMRQA